MNTWLFEGQWLTAVFMWHRGCDTLTIAQKFNCREEMIYRELPKYREKYPKIAEKAAA
jgi:hypothetical protein